MSIVPASRLSDAELAMLGNNLTARRRRPASRRRRGRQILSALNRSLDVVGEQIDDYVLAHQRLPVVAFVVAPVVTRGAAIAC